MGIQESYNRVAGEIQSQADLISQIRGILAKKAASSGGSGGYAIKTGTTEINSNVINTGLSDIEQFFIYKKSHAAAGLILLHYSKTDGVSRLYSTQWTSYSKNAYSGSDGATVDGGTVTIEETTPTSGGVSSNVSYTWVAFGYE